MSRSRNIFEARAPLHQGAGFENRIQRLGDKLNTMTFSNIGVVKLPKSMEPHVRKFIFTNGASKTSPVNVGGISYRDRMQITLLGRSGAGFA